MTNKDECREAFERYHIKEFGWELTRPEHYEDVRIKERWRLWQKAWKGNHEVRQSYSAELKPCPFCGEQPVFYNVPSEPEVHCEDCGMATASGQTQDECYEAWNTRATIPEAVEADCSEDCVKHRTCLERRVQEDLEKSDEQIWAEARKYGREVGIPAAIPEVYSTQNPMRPLVDKPLHIITQTGCSICGTDALHCSFWKAYEAAKEPVSLSLAEFEMIFIDAYTGKTHCDYKSNPNTIKALQAVLDAAGVKYKEGT
jgi:Lar family restriction alleviation protein